MDQVEQKNADFLRSMIEIAHALMENIQNKKKVTNTDEDFFTANFYKRMIRHAESVVYLSEKDFLHEAVVVARNLLEGLFYFYAYRENNSLASSWRDYAVYEDCEKAFRNHGKEGLKDFLSHLREKFGAEKIEQIEKKYNLIKSIQEGKLKKWHEKKSIKKLISHTSGLKVHYEVIYSDFSKAVHWTPSGVIGGDFSFKAALASTFQAIYEASIYINEFYDLSHDNELKTNYDNYVNYNTSLI